jgi:hypothetical protein
MQHKSILCWHLSCPDGFSCIGNNYVQPLYVTMSAETKSKERCIHREERWEAKAVRTYVKIETDFGIFTPFTFGYQFTADNIS